MNAFVFSGGGNLGSVQVGMLKALLEAGVVPDMVVGTSIGSVNAAFLAADPTPDHVLHLCDLWCDVRTRDIFPFNPFAIGRALFRQGALFPSDSWRRFLTERMPYERIEDAAIPLRITATAFEDGESVVLDSGSVIDAVLASTALPSIFPPHRIGDRYYLDGALSDQLPIKVAIEAGADCVYILAVSLPFPPPDPRSPRGILRHSLTILLFPRIRLDALEISSHNHPKLRIVQVPSVQTQVALWDMSCNSNLIQEAYEAAAAFLAERESQAADERTEVASVPEMEIETETPEDAGSPTASGDSEPDGEGSAPG